MKATRILLTLEDHEVGDDALGSWNCIESTIVRINPNETTDQALSRSFKDLINHYVEKD